MTPVRLQSKAIFYIAGILAPYVSVLACLFWLKNLFAAVLFYHAVLLICLIQLKGYGFFRPLLKGFLPRIGPWLCLGGLVPGFVILYVWPYAKLECVDPAELFKTLHLNSQIFLLFAVYACLVNPFLEECFWRGCFKPGSLRPNAADVLFAGYHALAVLPLLEPIFPLLILAAMVFVSWLFRQLYRITGGLLIPAITHLIADIAILCAVWKILHSQ